MRNCENLNEKLWEFEWEIVRIWKRNCENLKEKLIISEKLKLTSASQQIALCLFQPACKRFVKKRGTILIICDTIFANICKIFVMKRTNVWAHFDNLQKIFVKSIHLKECSKLLFHEWLTVWLSRSYYNCWSQDRAMSVKMRRQPFFSTPGGWPPLIQAWSALYM